MKRSSGSSQFSALDRVGVHGRQVGVEWARGQEHGHGVGGNKEREHGGCERTDLGEMRERVLARRGDLDGT